MRPRKVALGTFPPASPQDELDRLEARQQAAAAALGPRWLLHPRNHVARRDARE